MTRVAICLVLLTAALPTAGIAQSQDLGQPQNDQVADPSYIELVRSHLEFVIERGVDDYGDSRSGMWLATIDVRNGGLPEQPLPRQLRWYRNITSPRGSNLYWDQPTILAAYELTRISGDNRYARSADEYIRDFLARCVSPESGLFLWGNHIYYNVVNDEIDSFTGGYHECRPHTPAWETFWTIDAAVTEKSIRAMGMAHIKNQETGLFCRHANPQVPAGTFQFDEVQNAKPFLEAAASLIDSLCWLAEKVDDPTLAESALRVARYSYVHRDESTGLVRNQPVDKRWDYFASTTEVGLWAGSLLRAYERTGEKELAEIAEAVMRSWLRFGFDEDAGKYYGRLAVASGLSEPPEIPRGWIPPMHAEVFDIHERPTHNYPIEMAETCLSLYQATQAPEFLTAVDRWAAQIAASLPANAGRGAYAEDYGRAIHFLNRVALTLQRRDCQDLAHRVAEEAIEQLFIQDSGAFRSHAGEDRCDAIDGPGILLLALLYLETGQQPESAFIW